MFVFENKYADYLDYLKAIAAKMHVNLLDENTLVFPKQYASGYQKVILLPNGLQTIIYDFKTNQDMGIFRLRSTDEFYILRFDVLQIKDGITIHYENESLKEESRERSSVILTNSLFDFGHLGKSGTQLKGINIHIPLKWMTTFLGIGNQDVVLQKYVALKTASFNFEPLDIEYRKLFNEIFELDVTPYPMKLISIQNRIMLLIERFFSRLYKKMGTLTDQNEIKNDEIKRMMKVEAQLIKDYTSPPPRISELAKIATMSETKLKILFKKVYEKSPHEYYQKNRMFRAKYLLLEKKYSVKEVGLQLGFKNLSNFTIAFKKEFGMMPSEV